MHNNSYSKHLEPIILIQQFIREMSWGGYLKLCEDEKRLRSEVMVSWIKVNTDGAVRDGGSIGGRGGLIRDESGAWIHNFARRIDKCLVMRAKAWGAWKGARIAAELGFRRIIIESDSRVLIQGLSGEWRNGN